MRVHAQMMIYDILGICSLDMTSIFSLFSQEMLYNPKYPNILDKGQFGKYIYFSIDKTKNTIRKISANKSRVIGFRKCPIFSTTGDMMCLPT